MDTALIFLPIPTDEQPAQPPRPGDPCPRCGLGPLDYNGVLMLACEACGYVLGEGGGCT